MRLGRAAGLAVICASAAMASASACGAGQRRPTDPAQKTSSKRIAQHEAEPEGVTKEGLSPREQGAAQRMRSDVEFLALEIGGRGLERPGSLEASEAFLVSRFEAQGYVSTRLPYKVGTGRTATEVANLQVEILGRTHPEQIVVVGAHYDTCDQNPGANDNASGVAAMLELSSRFVVSQPERTLRFVAFVNEEPPHFQRETMGSWVYAKSAKARGEQIVAMLSLETMGYYTQAPKSQHYPAIVRPFFSDVGNFIAFVSQTRSRPLIKQLRASFREAVNFPVESLAAADSIQGIGWSDHWSFYKQGYPAVMVTDTAPNRYPYYHDEHDTPDKLDYASMSRVVTGLEAVVRDLVDSP